VTKKAKEEKDSLAIEQSKRIAELEAQIAELTETLKRVQAEFINYKNRTEKETRQLIEYANGDFIRKILPVLDSFELALKSTSEPEKFRKGIEMVYAQLLDVLRQEGLMPIDSQGKKFDPYLHEVLLKEKSDKEEDTVLEELQKGYKLKDKVLRHSKVKISG
jgi:molecular chaperone GrpE